MTTLLDRETGWNEPGAKAAQAKIKVPSPEELNQAEAERQQRRAAIRAEIAIAELAQQQWKTAVGGIAAINERKEAIAAEHVAECAPLQRRLSEIEAIQIASIKARSAGDPAIEHERRELLASLREKNATLETAIEYQDKLLSQIEVERLDAAKRCGTSSLQTDLIHAGRLDLVAKMRVTSLAVNWATGLVARLEERLQQHPNIHLRAELSAAHEALAQATRQAAEALRAVVDE